MFKRVCVGLAFVALLCTVSQGDAQIWGGGGGPHFMVFSPPKSELNSKLGSVLGNDFGERHLFVLTGGYGSASVAPNIRIGGMGAGGRQIITDSYRRATLSIDLGGFLTEYSIPWKRFQFCIGGVVGGGNINLKISRASPLDWDDFWDNFEPDSLISSKNFSGDLSGGFFYGEPYLGIQYAITPWAYIKVDVGYSIITLGSGSWEESGTELTGAPYMNLTSAFVRAGVFFGYFGKE